MNILSRRLKPNKTQAKIDSQLEMIRQNRMRMQNTRIKNCVLPMAVYQEGREDEQKILRLPLGKWVNLTNTLHIIYIGDAKNPDRSEAFIRGVGCPPIFRTNPHQQTITVVEGTLLHKPTQRVYYPGSVINFEPTQYMDISLSGSFFTTWIPNLPHGN